MAKETLCDKFVKATKKAEPYSATFWGVDEATVRAVKRKAKKWPSHSKGWVSAKWLCASTEKDDNFPLNYGDDIYWTGLSL